MTPKNILSFIAFAAILAGTAGSGFAESGQDRSFEVKVVAEQANLRERPDISSAIVQNIPEGTVLQADRKEGEWYLVRYTLDDGSVIAGYIHESLVTLVRPSQVRPPAEPVRPSREPEPAARPAVSRVSFPRERTGTPFEVALSLGGGSVIARNLNDAAQGLADLDGAVLGVPAEGPVDRLRLALMLSAEVSCRVSPWLAVGVGADLLRGSDASTVRYPGESATPTLAVKPSVRALPVKALVRFYPGTGFYFKGALGYYSAKAGYRYRFDGPDLSQEWRGTATGHCLGLEVGAGGDWRVGRRTSLFAEVGYRMARVESLGGTESYSDSTGASIVTDGSLWYFEQEGPDARDYPLLFILADRPAEPGISGARPAEVNLSGTMVRVGIRFGF